MLASRLDRSHQVESRR